MSCVAFGCIYPPRGEQGSDVSLHVFPKDEKLRKIWENACGRVHFPTNPRLCSRHFTPDAFRRPKPNKDVRAPGSERTLKPEAVPTVFFCRKSLRPIRSKNDLGRSARIAPVWLTPHAILYTGTPGSDPVRPSVGVQCFPSTTDAATQTEDTHTVNAAVQCPEDVNCQVFRDHTYARRVLVDLNLQSKCSLPTTLETFHSEYLKYLQEDTFVI